jgi:ribosomal protein S18 acetylase RimI-like enzyme
VTVQLRRLGEGEARLLRDLRLRALRDAPAAFADSLEEGRAQSPERWTEWTRTGAAGETQVTVVAVKDDRGVGMIVGRLLADPPGAAWLEALWVDPSIRRAGLGSGLIEAVADWSRERGATRLDLSVTEGNEPASALYAHAGFLETGRRRPLPADPSRTEVFLSRPLYDGDPDGDDVGTVDARTKARSGS